MQEKRQLLPLGETAMENTMLNRVKHAALCMQRNNWEQGVLAQAFLELEG